MNNSVNRAVRLKAIHENPIIKEILEESTVLKMKLHQAELRIEQLEDKLAGKKSNAECMTVKTYNQLLDYS